MSSARKMIRMEDDPEECSSRVSVSRPDRETDASVLQRREKQIEYGKNTLSYDAYVSKIPPGLRRSHHPVTPKKNLKYSRRQWDGLVKAWKKRIHAFDMENETPLEGKMTTQFKRKRKNWSSSNSRTSSTLSLISNFEENVKEEPDLELYETPNNDSELDFPFLPTKEEASPS